ncbi:BarH-like 1 homeobox protein [Homalodisca vitripennis]|nr:BarH-like 1 homeobox protein [Homalodisca vitripennis]
METGTLTPPTRHAATADTPAAAPTKWKRQTAVGLELLAEAGNYAAFQRLYGGPPYCWPYPGAAGSTAPSAADLYYRQAAVAAAAVTTLQKPLAYRLYPGVAGPSHLPPPGLPAAAPYYHPLPPRSPSPSPPPPHSPQSVDVEDDSPDSPNVEV